jgi:hypothetical protein
VLTNAPYTRQWRRIPSVGCAAGSPRCGRRCGRKRDDENTDAIGQWQHDREQRHNIQKPRRHLGDNREKESSGLDWRQFFVTIWPDQGALKVLYLTKIVFEHRVMYLNTTFVNACGMR